MNAVTQAESEEVNREVDSFLQSQLVKDILKDNEIQSIREDLKLPPVSVDTTADSGVDSSDQERDPEVEQLERQELDSLLMPPPDAPPFGGGAKRSEGGILQRPALASLGIKDTVQERMQDESKKGE